jgi:tol-pal system protein YbgF
MRSSNHIFFTFCLTLTTGILWAYFIFAGYFNSGWEYKQEAQTLQENLDDSRFQVALLQHQMRDLEQTVASVLPTQKLAKNKTFDNLMLTLRAPASIPSLDLSSVILEKGKKYFADGKFTQAGEEFQKLKEQYPSSAYQVQARFFLAESLFLQREFKKCVEVIDDMISQYPDHELTGFILLRLGQISMHNNQTEEAQEIYRTVLNNFPQKPLKEQAQILLKSLEIE